jgi:hypothetical protein
MVKEASEPDESIFEEYWRQKVPVENRIKEWLKRADACERVKAIRRTFQIWLWQITTRLTHNHLVGRRCRAA